MIKRNSIINRYLLPNEPKPPENQACIATPTITTTPERLANLDAIRGFALLGILFLNIYFMANNFYGYAPHQPEILSDIIIEILSNFIFEGRFISLFSMLFGAGLWLQFGKAGNDKHAQHTIKRRLHWLIVFGLVHGVFIFSGDILLTYGLCGLLAYQYCALAPKALLAKSAKFILLAMMVMALISITIEDDPFYRGSAYYLQQLDIWTGSYTTQVMMQGMMVGYMLVIIPISILWYGAGLMLIGIYLMKQGYFKRGFSAKQLATFAVTGIIFAILDSVLSQSSSAVLKEISAIFMMLGAIPTALIYWHIIVKLCQNNPLKLTLLQNLGRVSLSFYILQSILGVLLLRHWMPQWQISFDRIDYMQLAIVLSVLQLGLAAIYVRFFNQGPLEYLMRVLSKRINI